MKTGQFIQQGDVIIKKVNISLSGMKNLSGMKKIKKQARGFVLAEGEATGHAHTTIDDIEMFEKYGIMYIGAKEKFTVTHEEHKPVVVEKGVYEIGIVQEYDHFAEEARNVAD
jgi:hypothetical protein